MTVSEERTMKTKVSYGKCSIVVQGVDMKCPLCGVLVKSGNRHSCERKAAKPVRVWQIGPDGTEYFAAHSEMSMRRYYKRTMGPDADDDLREHFEEVDDLDTEFQFNEDGAVVITSWRKLAESAKLPCQISTGYN